MSQFKIHYFGAFRNNKESLACALCGFYEQVHTVSNYSKIRKPVIVYGKLCFGKKKYWLFGRNVCPDTVHYHVRCEECKASWFESQETIPVAIAPVTKVSLKLVN